MKKNGTVLIAGHASGLGEALRARFDAEGYCVVPVSRSAARPWRVDLTDAAAVEDLFRRLDQQCPPLAGVIHNAMQFHRQPLMQTSPETLVAVWQSMVLTAFNTAQAAIPRLAATGGGTLIFSGASGSVRAGPGFAAFSASKFALRGLTQAMAREHAAQGIHVAHVVIDGLIRSAKTAERFKPAADDALIEPEALAEQYLHLFQQAPSVWTEELNIRPMARTR
jgi:NAD(P)-dependent dehydrogenase (short-subunit alcohol dehydrogenase family)